MFPPTSASDPTALARSEGTPVWSFGVLMNVKLTGEDTDGAFALVDHLADPGVGAPPHVHSNEEELFYVLDGEIECVWGENLEERVRVGPHGTVHLPPHVPHAFEVVSDQPCRMLVVVAPAGLEEFWLEAGEPAPELTTPPPFEPDPALLEAAGAYGVEFLSRAG